MNLLWKSTMQLLTSLMPRKMFLWNKTKTCSRNLGPDHISNFFIFPNIEKKVFFSFSFYVFLSLILCLVLIHLIEFEWNRAYVVIHNGPQQSFAKDKVHRTIVQRKQQVSQEKRGAWAWSEETQRETQGSNKLTFISMLYLITICTTKTAFHFQVSILNPCFLQLSRQNEMLSKTNSIIRGKTRLFLLDLNCTFSKN